MNHSIRKHNSLTRFSILNLRSSILAATGVLFVSGCTRDWKPQPLSMWNESRYKPMEPSRFYETASSSRPLVPGTVARGQLRTNEAMYTGRTGGALVSTFPFEMKQNDLMRGRERFNIYCAPCHGQSGDGEGMIVKRGFAKPPHYGIRRLHNAPVGHFYDVITNGYGAMYSYASRVSPEDRWRIAAYIRVLQRTGTGRPLPDDGPTGGGPSETAPSTLGMGISQGSPDTSLGTRSGGTGRDGTQQPGMASPETSGQAVPGQPSSAQTAPSHP